MPTSLAEEQRLMMEFRQIRNFPSEIGCIDCTHIKMGDDGGDLAQYYVNRKGFYSLNVQFTPILNPHNHAEQNYNEAHIATRNVVELCFGVWKQRFQCMPMKFGNVKTTLVALAVLHNIAIVYKDTNVVEDNYELSTEELPEQPSNMDSNHRRGRNAAILQGTLMNKLLLTCR
ncbi:uncharacterized protein LOC125075661 [Vanessa atalanta]|uniref:uncharacterized protein LOC125075661 n=1 Tax=Vanessa atalanta TaxID=42275 RepID=UPI001FCE1104|nr:uncharacterized protein LOC125075661 [Vanessa atalanta]